MDKFCTSCGAALKEGQRFCGACGTPAQDSGTARARPGQPARANAPAGMPGPDKLPAFTAQKLPFRALAEKIPAATRAEYPLLDKAIPFANQIACGIVAVALVVAGIAAWGGKSGATGGAGPGAESGFTVGSDAAAGSISASGGTNAGGPAKPGSPEALAARFVELDPKAESEMTQAETGEYNQIFETVKGWGEGSKERNEFFEAVYERQVKTIERAIDQLAKQGETARAEALAKLLEALEESETYSLAEQRKAVAAAQAALAAAAAKKEAEAAYKSGKTAPESDFNVRLNDDGATCSITGYTGPGGTVIIPAAIQGMPVTAVLMSPSYRNVNTTLVSVVIPAGVKFISAFSFSNCINLRSVTIPDSVTVIELATFKGCTSLASVTIPDSVKKIDDGAFEDCTSLASITIPDSVTEIGRVVFMGCTSLVTVTISPVKRKFADYNSSFARCPKLSLASQAALKAAGYTDSF